MFFRSLALAAWIAAQPSGQAAPAQIQDLKITVLSTMLVGDFAGVGEWGFSALIEADGHRILFDTGMHPRTVLQNASDLKIDLSGVKEVILSHNHPDHVGGLLTLRTEMRKQNPQAFSLADVATGIFFSRPAAGREANPMVSLKKEFEAVGGTFLERDKEAEIFPGAWLTGPVPRKYPERNWVTKGQVRTPAGLVQDTIPEDQALVLNTSQGLVLVAGCSHAGVINTLTFAHDRFPDRPVLAVIGGLHLFEAGDEQLNWTADRLKDLKPAHFLGAHCTGIEAVYRIRERVGLTRQTAVVGSVGSTFVLGEGIHPGPLAK